MHYLRNCWPPLPLRGGWCSGRWQSSARQAAQTRTQRPLVTSREQASPPLSSWLEKLKRCAVQSTGRTRRAGAACHNSQCSIQISCKPNLLVLISALMLPLCPPPLPLTSCCCCRRLAAGESRAPNPNCLLHHDNKRLHSDSLTLFGMAVQVAGSTRPLLWASDSPLLCSDCFSEGPARRLAAR